MTAESTTYIFLFPLLICQQSRNNKTPYDPIGNILSSGMPLYARPRHFAVSIQLHLQKGEINECQHAKVSYMRQYLPQILIPIFDQRL